MPVYKHVVFMDVNCRGFSEIWYRTRPSPAPLSTVWEEANTMLTKRALLLGAQGRITACRVGDADDEIGVGSPGKGDARLFRQGYPGAADYQCAQPDSAAVTTFYDATGLRKRNTFLRGIPDDVEVNGGQPTLVGAAALWTQRYQAWIDEINQGGWGWLARSVKQTGGGVFGAAPLALYTQYADDPRKIQITFARALFSAAEVEAGEPIEVVFKQVGGRAGSRLNGPQLVVPTAPTVCYTFEATALLPWSPGGVGTRYSYSFVDIAEGRLAKIGTRKAGNVSNLSRGRQKAVSRG